MALLLSAQFLTAPDARAQCDFESIPTPFGTDPYWLVEWNGRLVAGGAFTSMGAGAPASRVAVFDERLWEWAPLGEGLGDLPPGYSSWAIGQLCVHEGRLHATGRFRSSSATVLNGVAWFDEASSSGRGLGSVIEGMTEGNSAAGSRNTSGCTGCAVAKVCANRGKARKSVLWRVGHRDRVEEGDASDRRVLPGLRGGQ